MTLQKNMDFHGKTALLVDPDPVFSALLANHLKKNGFRTTRVSTLAEAEKLLKTRRFDLAVSEIMLEYPDSGFVLCWKIKRKTPETRIILVSGVTLESGLHFNLAGADEKNWIRADSILDKEIRLEQFDHELLRIFR